LVYVFKTVADQYVGQLSLFKVLSGTVRNDDHLIDTATGTDERLHGCPPAGPDQQFPTSRSRPATRGGGQAHLGTAPAARSHREAGRFASSRPSRRSPCSDSR
jgi:hypothetical protein